MQLETNGKGPAPVQVKQPEPCDGTVLVNAVHTPRGPFVALSTYTAAGMHVFYLPPDVAVALAAQMERTATLAKSGLHLPTPTKLD